ncbi:uncharacterized protein SAPINGB_P003980 [Magnusiomyces paraingens]|uniref:Amino acid permease/ SLC12A domain-containing protein n=1 Tax=Magnusiomyces paraingens TaxID=2606893 RepID=A0A5E8BXK9_9ASCO|nr:uncharacterized protein SAPINGB_P003980 [Saprochaete ingens]VVT54247.1 unnamed protein product [Saprochaete ingens]
MEKTYSTDLERNGQVLYGRNSSSSNSFNEKKNVYTYTNPVSNLESGAVDGSVVETTENPQGRLQRDLKARHITMIAIGGALGTGLVIGSGSALAQAGPASLLIAYLIVGFIVYLVMCALGEMATWIPLSEGFPGYASRFCDPCLGFAVGWVYYMKYIIVTPNQLVAGALVIQYWLPREKVNPGVWITIFLVVIIFLNLFGVKIFGELEFWLSCLKVITMLGLIMVTLIIALGGGPDHDRRGFRYWKDPGAFKPYSKGTHSIEGSEGKFVAWASVLVTAVFAFLGTELVGVTVGEAENPRRNIPRAIKLTFFRILLFYIVAIFFLGMCVPYNDTKLAFANKASTSAAASPFVVAITNAGIPKLNQIINACILIFIFSSSNSDLYIATRTLYGMAKNGKAPKIFLRINRWGIPYVALGCSAMFCCLAYLCTAQSSAKVFNYFVNVVSIMGLLTWICILITHICFVRGRKAQGIPKSEIVYKAPFGEIGSWIALVFCIIIALIKNFTAFVFSFDKTSFITGYIGIPIFLILVLGYKFIMKSKFVKPTEIDFYPPLRHEIDCEEQEFLERQLKENIENPPSFAKKIYNHSIGYLF